MPSLDRTTYIADCCLAARRMGIYLREIQDTGQYRFDWYDPATDVVVVGEIANDRINAFEIAANKLTDYLKYTPKNPPYETHRKPSPDTHSRRTSREDGGVDNPAGLNGKGAVSGE